MKKFGKIIAAAVTFGLLSSAVFQGTNHLFSRIGGIDPTKAQITEDQEQKTGTSGIVQTSSTSGNEIAGVSDVVEQVLPSIVAIDVKVVSKQQDFFGRVYESEGEGSGSGIIIKEDSDHIYIVTNNHVVADSVKVTIKFLDETTAEAVVTGTDEASDLAVVKVAKSDLKDETLSQIKTAALADSDTTKVGEQAIAIGNALGYGTSVTVGYVSAKDREIGISTEGHETQSGSQETMKLIQTDAAINPGNSGGALVNADGEVMGINSSKFASEEVEGMGFAIPVSDALPIIEKLINGSQAQHSSSFADGELKSGQTF